MRDGRRDIHNIYPTSLCSSAVFTCTGTLGTTAERGPLLESIYRVSLTVDVCKGNKIISFKKFILPQPVGGPEKKKKIRGRWACAHWLRRPCSVQHPTSADNVTLLAFAAVGAAVQQSIDICCHACRAHSSKPATAACGSRMMGQTDRRTDKCPTVSETLPAYCASSINNSDAGKIGHRHQYTRQQLK